MPDIETDCLAQKAVYWPATGIDNYGRRTIGTAQELSVRWIDRVSESTDSDGAPVQIVARVIVDRNISLGSIFWKGELVDLPSPVTDLLLVVEVVETPDLKGRKFRREVRLMRSSDTQLAST